MSDTVLNVSAIDAAVVRRLVAAQFPLWADLPVVPILARGTDNALFRLGDDLVARLPTKERAVATLAKEREWLPKLAPLLPVAVPVPVADGKPAEAYPHAWAVYNWLKGEDATVAPAAGLAHDLARFVAALQAIDPTAGPPPGEHNFFRGAPLATRDEVTRAAIGALAGELDAAALTSAWEEALAAPEWDGPPVWIHGDLDRRNVLVENGRLSGVVDFGGLAVGDPASDVMAAWKTLRPEERDGFRAALSVDDATWARARGWALSQAVIALSSYTLETSPVLVREARRWLEQAGPSHSSR